MSFLRRLAGVATAQQARDAAKKSWERRDAYRAPVNLPVSFVAEPGASSICGKLVDVSASGARLVAADELLLDGRITLSITFPNEFLSELDDEEERRVWLGTDASRGALPPPFTPLAIEGTVVTGQFDPRHRYYIYGVNFAPMEQSVREELYRFITLWQRHKLRLLRRR